MTMFKTLRPLLRSFKDDKSGSISIEALLFLPFIMVTLAATFSLFDAFRYKTLNSKAAYTLSDALSRETDAITPAYVDGLVDTLEYLTRSDGLYSLRITVVTYDADTDSHSMDWSEGRGNFNPMNEAELAQVVLRLPELIDNERLIVVETQTDYESPFTLAGLASDDLFYNMVFTRPRFAPKLVWVNDEVNV